MIKVINASFQLSHRCQGHKININRIIKHQNGKGNKLLKLLVLK